ncbi:glycosyltransferase family 2 protein [Flavobacterium humidisoli]|uniref:Glycosyltransferase family 2 protein n=1 Tax=Flavobacterium humidisoli TaxID=2937442 RepID=A0ABY4LY04_9FLAO|nr:glycosyltransferase family 2 protein [Flavobacterium humidisoli]UPZ17964.1 glycosyltransferase family 2 protein [Flavobacterium humidisoli]
MKISGLIITLNEEKNIGKCIDSLFRICDEIVVVDSFSNDKTAKIAKEKGAIIIKQSFLGDGPQRSYGLQYCKNDWILNLDADEFLDKDAENFIFTKEYLEGNYDAFSFRIKNFLDDKLINFSGWYPDYTVRLFNKKTAHPSDSIVHQRIIAQNAKKVPVHILHYAWKSLDHIILKKNLYTTWQSQQLFDKNVRVKFYKPILNGIVAFIRCYFFKKGIFNGIDGLSFALIQSFFCYMKYAKLLKIQKQKI